MLRLPAVLPECHRTPFNGVSRFTAFVKGNWKWAVYRVGVYDNLPRRHGRQCEREGLSFAVKVFLKRQYLLSMLVWTALLSQAMEKPQTLLG
jgi:hypothetical protein